MGKRQRSPRFLVRRPALLAGVVAGLVVLSTLIIIAPYLPRGSELALEGEGSLCGCNLPPSQGSTRE
jgi:hypothetical protein